MISWPLDGRRFVSQIAAIPSLDVSYRPDALSAAYRVERDELT